VIVTLSMIPYIDLLWHMGCSGLLCKFETHELAASHPDFDFPATGRARIVYRSGGCGAVGEGIGGAEIAAQA
jgi:hypothetical protein